MHLRAHDSVWFTQVILQSYWKKKCPRISCIMIILMTYIKDHPLATLPSTNTFSRAWNPDRFSGTETSRLLWIAALCSHRSCWQEHSPAARAPKGVLRNAGKAAASPGLLRTTPPSRPGRARAGAASRGLAGGCPGRVRLSRRGVREPPPGARAPREGRARRGPRVPAGGAGGGARSPQGPARPPRAPRDPGTDRRLTGSPAPSRGPAPAWRHGAPRANGGVGGGGGKGARGWGGAGAWRGAGPRVRDGGAMARGGGAAI